MNVKKTNSRIVLVINDGDRRVEFQAKDPEIRKSFLGDDLHKLAEILSNYEGVLKRAPIINISVYEEYSVKEEKEK